MVQRPKLSVIIPVFNEKGNIPMLYRKLKDVLLEIGLRYEMVFVDDGSKDSSFSLLKRIRGRDRKHVELIKLRRNFGKGTALNCGFRVARGEIIITIDGDLQDEPQDIPKLLSKINEGYDVVSGWKVSRKDSWNKKLPSYLFNLLTSIIMGFRIHDINCGLKVYRKEVLDEVTIRGDLYRFIPLLAHQKGFSIAEIPTGHRKRVYGKSKYGLKRIFSGLIDVLTVFFLTRFQTKPSHFFGIFGITFLLVGVFADGYVAILKVVTGSTQGHIPLLLFGILLIIVGVQLISLGLLGELYLSSREDMQYHVEYDSRTANPERIAEKKKHKEL